VDTLFIPVQGIFDDDSVFTRYGVSIRFTELVIGGIPQNPEMIESWLRKRVLGGDQELAIMFRRTLADLEIEVAEDASIDDMIAAAKQVASERNGNTFRRSEGQLILNAYNIKAMLKEATSILYPWASELTGDVDKDGKLKKAITHRWGPTGKKAASLVAERIYVSPYAIPLDRFEPDGTLMQVGHVDGPKGKRSILSYADYCVQPEIDFTLSSAEDMVTREQWERILVLGQRLGTGASRSMGHGQFKITAFDRL
jgi:hypothetical protein